MCSDTGLLDAIKHLFYFRYKSMSSVKIFSLRYAIIFMTVLIVLIPSIITGLYIYIIINYDLTDRTNKDISLFLQQVNQNVSTKFNSIEQITDLIRTNRIINDELLNKSIKKDEYTKLISEINITNEIKTCLLVRNWSLASNAPEQTLVKKIYLFQSKTEFYKVSPSIALNENICDEIHQKFYDISISSKTLRSVFPPSDGDQIIYLNCDISNSDTLNSIGRLFLDIDGNVLSEAYRNILKYEGANWYLVDNQGTILLHNGKNALGEKIDSKLFNIGINDSSENGILFGKEYISAFKNVSKYELTSIILIPREQIEAKLIHSLYNYFLIIFLILLISLSVSLYFSFKITNPLKDLTNKIKLVGDGNFDVKMPSYQYRELDRLSSVFNDMTSEIKYLIKDVYEKQLLLKQAEHKSLQSQMNPHFMFNVLATIGYQAQISKNETIYRMVTSFSQMLQANIYLNDKDRITIRDELKYIEFYLYLQNIRFSDKFKYHINIHNNSILDYYMPKLSVQPLVENAVVHGLEGKYGNGSLILNIREDSGSVFFEVIDDGLGFDATKINISKSENAFAGNEAHNHIGLANTNKRIKLLYGEQYGIKIQSKPNEGSKVTVNIPVDRRDAQDVPYHGG